MRLASVGIGAILVSTCVASSLSASVPTTLRFVAGGFLAPGLWMAIFPPAYLGVDMVKYPRLMFGLGATLDFVLYSSICYLVSRGLAIQEHERDGR